MATYVVNHKVQDFDKWKRTYDAFQPQATASGITDRFVLQSADDPNHVVVIGEGSADDLQKFLGSEDLRGAMEGAGVVGAPDIYIGENKK